MLGLRSFNIVLVASALPIEQIDLNDLSFNGKKLSTIARLPHLIQAKVDEYSLLALPDRLQITADTAKATRFRMDAVTNAVRNFIDGYVPKKALTAIGHNFTGSFLPSGGADAFMADLAYPDWFAQVIAPEGATTQSVTTKFQLEGFFVTLRLEPLVEAPDQIFYDFNVGWGLNSPLPIPSDIRQNTDSLSESFELVSRLTEQIANVERG